MSRGVGHGDPRRPLPTAPLPRKGGQAKRRITRRRARFCTKHPPPCRRPVRRASVPQAPEVPPSPSSVAAFHAAERGTALPRSAQPRGRRQQAAPAARGWGAARRARPAAPGETRAAAVTRGAAGRSGCSPGEAGAGGALRGPVHGGTAAAAAEAAAAPGRERGELLPRSSFAARPFSLPKSGAHRVRWVPGCCPDARTAPTHRTRHFNLSSVTRYATLIPLFISSCSGSALTYSQSSGKLR